MPTVRQQFLPENLPEIFRPDDSAAASRATRRGELRRLARGLYTWNLDEPVEQLLRRNWINVAAIYFPDAVIVDRSAIDGRPAADGSLFLDAGPSYTGQRPVKLPGLTLKPRRGPGRVEGDMGFGELHRSGQARTALDNMRTSRARAGVARTLSNAELEEWLERLAAMRGEDELLHIRDEAGRLASLLDAEEEQHRLDRLIGGLLGTRETRLATKAGQARGRRAPFDTERIALFEGLHGELAGHLAPVRPEAADPNRVFAFFESYFSNFIEGTEFEVEVAEEIVFEGVIPAERPEDAHDVLGTFKVVTDPVLRGRVPENAEDLWDLLCELNRRILEQRPSVNPGELKTEPNRAGGTAFVAPELVKGTLREAWRFYSALPAGFPRAVFAMFAVTEVHPFADGNGRVARALMNAEFTSAVQCRVAIPLSYRPDYLGALRAMSRQGNYRPLLRMVERAHRWSSLIDWSNMEQTLEQLRETNALIPSDEAEDQGLVLLDPEP